MKPYHLFLLLTLFTFTACQSPAEVSQPPLPTATPGATAVAPTPSGFFHVQGNTVLDGRDQPILLRGVNMDTYYYSYTWDPVAAWRYATLDDMHYLADLGVTAVRLGLHWAYFDTSLGYDLIDTYLDWGQQTGIALILDMHIVPPDADVMDGRIWDDPTAQQQFRDLWVAIASRYASETGIAGYDLYNEPAPPTADQWWQLAAQTITAIRAVDTNHILFVENPLIEDNTFRLMADDNIIYSFHDYSPFSVSHALADWVGDSPLPNDDSYPGPALTSLEWADWSADAAEFTDQAGEWLYWDSGLLTVPAGVEFATLKPAVWGNVGAVWFDDLELWHNGVSQAVYNSGIEDASVGEAGQPANWYFWSNGNFTGTWSDAAAHSGTYSLNISGAGDGVGIWAQSNWIMTKPLFQVQAGDTLQVRGWIYAPENEGGVALGVDYLRGVYEEYGRAHLLADMQPYLDWAAAHQVPLYVGEFGSMAAAPGDSHYHLVADKISVMNEAGLHWALWTYRDNDPASQSFGLFHGPDLDEPLADILRLGLTAGPH